MTHTARAVFTFKSAETKAAFINFCSGERGLGITRAWEGCISIECYESADNPLEMTIWQKWESASNHEAYVAMRKEAGDFDMLADWVAAPPDIKALHPVDMVTDEEKIHAIIKDMCDVDHSKGTRHMSEGCVFIRPTGNPLTKEGWEAMMNNADVKVESNELLKVHKLHIVGDLAYACYTTHGKFSYKGQPNDDVAVLSAVFRKTAGNWEVVHGQRSTGRSPDAPRPEF